MKKPLPKTRPKYTLPSQRKARVRIGKPEHDPNSYYMGPMKPASFWRDEVKEVQK